MKVLSALTFVLGRRWIRLFWGARKVDTALTQFKVIPVMENLREESPACCVGRESYDVMVPGRHAALARDWYMIVHTLKCERRADQREVMSNRSRLDFVC